MPSHGELTRNESYEAELPLIGGKQAVVLTFVRVRGKHGATREEIANGTGLKECSVCGRVNELLKDGQLIESGEKRIGTSGKGNSVIIAKEFSNEVANQVPRRILPDGEAERREGAEDSRQQGNRNGRPASERERRSEVGGLHDMGSTKLAASNAELVDAAVQYVSGERKGCEIWRVGVEIANLRKCGVLAWPEADLEQWLAAVEAAVKSGRLTRDGSWVKVAPAVVEAKPVQKELF